MLNRSKRRLMKGNDRQRRGNGLRSEQQCRISMEIVWGWSKSSSLMMKRLKLLIVQATKAALV